MKKRKISITINSPVIISFVFACFIVLLLGLLSGNWLVEKFFMTYRSSLSNPLTYLRMFTHVLGHSGWAHFIGNVSYILLLGPMLEEKYGGKKIVEIILITAFVTAIMNMIIFSNVALCGASGIVFAFILMTSFTGFKQGEIPLTFILVAVIFIGQQVWEGLFVNNNISNLSHILGGIVGAIAGYNLNMKRR